MRDAIDTWLRVFDLDMFVREHVATVLLALPEPVRDDLMSDPTFVLYDYEPGPDVVMQVPVGVPGERGHSRSVVLKRTLRHRPRGFVCYIIAHELAHAYLRNEGRHADEDPEFAADALAAEWGFPRPTADW